MTAPDITVIIPTRNRCADLQRCLTALAAQDFPRDRFEVIICDDGSSESLTPALETGRQFQLQLRLAQQSPKGPAAARNLGIRHARAAIVAMTDSDTLPERTWLSRLYEMFQQHPEAAGVEGRVYANNDGEFDPLGEGPSNQTGGVYLTCNCAYRRAALFAAGGFDETFPYPAYEDTELAAHISQAGKILWQPEAVVLHPQRPLTWRTVLKKLRHWEYVMLMGYRYGYLAWRQYPVKYPRVRVAALSVIALPLAKFKLAAHWLGRNPVAAAKLAFLGVVESAGALVLVAPKSLFGKHQHKIPRRSYLEPDTLPGGTR